MSDIVEQLRAPLGVMQCEERVFEDGRTEKRWIVAVEAAAEIERLRAALRQIEDVGFVQAKDAPAIHDEAIKIARAALETPKPPAQEADHD